jgi:putative ABC transport system substrate-binding protein
MQRRKFITLLGGAAAAWPLTVRAQDSAKPRRIGFLAGGSRPALIEGTVYDGFRQGMRQLGYTEGKDFIIEWRFAEGKYERFPDLAAELARLNVDVIVLGAMAAVRPTQKVTSTIPIVMGNSIDPVGNGLVASLARPGGNTTGLSSAFEDYIPKLLELVKTIVPRLSSVAIFINPNNEIHSNILKYVQGPAAKANLTVLPIRVGAPEDIEGAFTTMSQGGAGAMVVPADAFFITHRKQLIELAINNKIVSIFAQREYALAGGLMSYGENLADFYRRSATFVDKIFKGSKASDLPVEQPTHYNLVINLKTAKALGLTVPPTLLALADEVIE